MKPEDRLVQLGVITGARGIKGEVWVESFAADPADVAAYGTLVDETGARPLALSIVGAAKGRVIARIDGIGDRTAAEALVGRGLYVRRDALPPAGEDEYYEVDLIGLEAQLVSGERLGRVVGVADYGAGALVEVKGAAGASVLLPFNRRAAPVVDLEAGVLVLDPPAGLLDQGSRPGADLAREADNG